MQSRCKKLRDKIIKTFLDELRGSDFYQIHFKSAFHQCIQKLENRQFESILCYGLGSFQDSVEIASRYQLALLILMHNYLEQQGHSALSNTIEVYDPSFDEIDKEVLLSFSKPRFKLIEENEYCARKIATTRCDTCVLVYMPHLDKYLYNNLLGSNWSVANLQLLVILGNSFNEMIDNETLSKCKSDLHYMNQLVNKFNALEERTSTRTAAKKKNKRLEVSPISHDGPLTEYAINDESFRHKDIFNSLAFHVIDKSWLIRFPDKILKTTLENWSCVICDNTEVWVDD